MAKKRITKVYTKTGDEGLTSLVGGARVSKASLRVEAYGDVDEHNAVLGIARAQALDKELEPLNEFILPSGSAGGSYMHLSRTVSRRAERKIVKLMEDEEVGGNTLIYMNRLSDLLFVMARIENKRSGFTETFVEFKKD